LAFEVRDGNHVVRTDPARLDIDYVHAFLVNSYWSRGIPRDVVARVISDCATFAYIADVFVDEAHRGKGLGKLLMQAMMTHPDLQGLRRWSLATRDAHGLYRQFGFSEIAHPERLMEIANPDVYERERPA
jgi:GNAT superfamily N-acetyltransferase